MNLNANTIVIPRIHEYTQRVVHTSLVLDRIVPRTVVKKNPTLLPKPMPTICYLDETELFQYNFTGSKIVWCKLNDDLYETPKYAFIIKILCQMMTLYARWQYTYYTRNIKAGVINERGFKYNKKLRVSFRGVDANHALHEIINITKLMNYKIELEILLKTGEIINPSL
jgi:hypothetical protein